MTSASEKQLVARKLSLQQRKAGLEDRIVEEMKKPIPCVFTLQRLKRVKLRLKDGIASTQATLESMTAKRLDNPVSA